MCTCVCIRVRAHTYLDERPELWVVRVVERLPRTTGNLGSRKRCKRVPGKSDKSKMILQWRCPFGGTGPSDFMEGK